MTRSVSHTKKIENSAFQNGTVSILYAELLECKVKAKDSVELFFTILLTYKNAWIKSP
jgi:hypothetical protein